MMKKLGISHSFLICTFTIAILTIDKTYGKPFQALKNSCITKSNSTTVDELRNSGRSICKIYADLRSDVELECPVTEVSLTQYEWYKANPNGLGRNRMTQFRGRFELSSQGHVRIRSITAEDSGVYICKVTNNPETYVFEIIVSAKDGFSNNNLIKSTGTRRTNVEEPFSEPHILGEQLPPNDKILIVDKGKPLLHLKCESKGNPKPTITWYKNDKILSSSRGNVSPLKLMNLSKIDSGVYKCESVNIFGVAVYELTVQVADAWHGSTEILELNPPNSTVLEGNSVNISCIARFETDPYFFWLKKLTNNKNESDRVFFHSDTSSFYEVLRNTSVKGRGEQIFSTELVLTNVTRNDTGIYLCAVAGPQGFNFSEATVIVESDSSHMEFSNFSRVPAHWAILWTTAFIMLVIIIVLIFARIYGCRSNKSRGSIKSRSPPLRKITPPERSPQTMSTHCTANHMQRPYCNSHNAFSPLMGESGSCSLSSHSQDCRGSSEDSLSGWQSLEAVPEDRDFSLSESGSQVSRNSTLLAELEAARSYCNISYCSGCSESELESEMKSNRSSFGYCSANGLYNNRRSQQQRVNYHHQPRSKPISSVPLNSPCSQSTASSLDVHSYFFHYPNPSLQSKPNVYQSHRKDHPSQQRNHRFYVRP